MLSLMVATDFTDLAARMSAGVAGVRACLILSRDGLSLGAHPADGEARGRQAWELLQRIGDPQRGFIDMGTEIWVVATGAAYAAVMVATPEAKPGILLDRMEAQLLAAEETRSVAQPEVQAEPQPEPVMASRVVDLSARVDVPSAPKQAELPAKEPEAHAPEPPRPVHEKAGTVDRVALAREFGRLFDNGPGRD